MPLELPEDSRGQPAQALSLTDGGSHAVTVTGPGAARNSTAFSATTKIVRLYTSSIVFFKLGDSSVVADMNDHIYAGSQVGYLDIHLKGNRYISFYTPHSDYNPVVYISELE